MKATKYTNKELVEIYKNLKTSAKILGFSSASDSEMIVEIELEAAKRHLNLVDGTVEETAAEGTSEVETTEQAQAEENKDTFEYRNYIISGNERTGIIAIDNHGNFSPKVYKTVEEAKKAVDEDIEYAEKKYAEMEAEQTEVEETAETETEETVEQAAEQETVEGISKMETTTLIIHDGTTSVRDTAFEGCTGLTSIVIPDSVIEIGNSAFFGCTGLTIYGVKGSYAETYAKENNIPFCEA